MPDDISGGARTGATPTEPPAQPVADQAAPRYTIRPLRWADARTISGWHYPKPYDVYDMNMRIPMLIQQLFLWLGQSIYFAVYASGIVSDGQIAPDIQRHPVADGQASLVEQSLVGFFSFVPRGAMLDIGVAMRPDLTGRGLGLSFMQAGLAFARATFKPSQFRLDVAVFNQRARRVYERAGFQAARPVYRRMRGRDYDCLEMVRDA